MKIELKEHELERALEVYLQGLYNKTVTVTGFDLSGMRSKDGLSAMIDIEIDGETNAREPKTESNNVKPTNTSRRTEQQQPEPKPSNELSDESMEQWGQFLKLITSNPNDCNYDAIHELLATVNEEVAEKIHNYSLFIDMEQRTTEMLATASKSLQTQEEHTDEIETEETETEAVEPVPEPEVTEEKPVTEEPQPKRSIFGSNPPPTSKAPLFPFKKTQ